MDNNTITKALTMLEAFLEKKPTAHQELVTQAETILSVIRVFRTDKDFDRILNEVVSRYETNVGIKTFDPDILVNDSSSDIWFTSERDGERPYFERYRTYLRQSGWDEDVIDNLEVNCERTLSRCANPKESPDSMDSKKRGMVMGDVQAGKTANYLGLINLACDFGYHVIVLLAGLTNSLRQQTQDRVDMGFIGADSNSIGSGLINYIGVGESVHQYYAIPLTNADWDFKKFIQKNTNAQAMDFNKPVILVVKKNASILKSVHDWLKPGDNISGNSILIIDDEADNASPNTKRPEYDPSAVNRRIRDIYNKFPIASYIGFTATPFANIFINPFDVNDDDQDLFPHDFIVQLNAPDYYFGGESVFPRDGSIPSMIRMLDTEEKNFIPVKHKKDFVVSALPDSLKEAILSFLINNVVRSLRGDKYKHRSMMINVTALNAPQESVSEAVKSYLALLKNIIEQDAYKPEKDFIKNAEMRKIYDLFTVGDETQTDFYAQVRNDFAWVDIQHGLYAEIRLVETTIINNRYSGDFRYDYNAHADIGSRVIVIGGFVLSRGLTLEGLCVSYYSRSAAAYDTLLQMCRWFGYRPRYQDLCRIYMSQASIDCFGSVLDAVRDLKEQFREMELQGKKPEDFGLMVKESPATLETTLLVTARNKMRNTQVFEHYVNYGGVYADTSKLFKDVEKNRKNHLVVETFIAAQAKKGKLFVTIDNRFMMSHVSKDDIASLIKQIIIPSGRGINQRFDCVNLAAYTSESKLFPEWDVVIATGDSERTSYIQGKSLSATERTFHLGASDENYIRMGGSNNRIVDPGIFNSGVTITPEQRQEILSKKRTRNANKPADQLTATDWLKLRERPLLAIYFIDLKIDNSKLSLSERDRYVSVKEAFGSDLLVGFAVGFPSKEAKERIVYRGNLVMVAAINADDDFDEEELSNE
ncbi:Z1 domain-containing protein [Kineothrix alysoides]|uniref:Z1 domain-containing protein n=1 Tax=Kineothrix alysoides TaxID=1469948 RepID=A0A4R1R0S3_9FIRM|nr:Z1 domain-containing protein [Kineothrix alysoides]TCL58879.1 Z1 domain-containing protein [Kineothrix alysoides]